MILTSSPLNMCIYSTQNTLDLEEEQWLLLNLIVVTPVSATFLDIVSFQEQISAYYTILCMALALLSFLVFVSTLSFISYMQSLIHPLSFSSKSPREAVSFAYRDRSMSFFIYLMSMPTLRPCVIWSLQEP